MIEINQFKRQHCSECGELNETLVHIGEPVGDPYDWDSQWLTLCQKCLRKALNLIEETE